MRVIGILSGSTFISSCGSSERSKKLVSYIMPPEDGAVPGEAYYYPSTCTECPAGCGLTVKSREGWPVHCSTVCWVPRCRVSTIASVVPRKQRAPSTAVGKLRCRSAAGPG